MKITFIIGSMTGGGAERVISVLANSFANRGYDVSLLTIIEDNVSYELSPNIKYFANKSNEVEKFKRIKSRYSFTKRVLKEIKPDVLISFTTEINIYALVASLGLNIKTIISERNDPYKDPPSKITRLLRNIIYYLSDWYVFQTEDAKAYFSKTIQNKGSIIPNPLKNNLPDRYKGIRKREFVTVARLSKQKNLKMLIDAFSMFCSEYKNYVLKIYGDGPLHDEIEDYIKKKGLSDQILLMGFVKDVHSYIIDASAFVLTSDYEGISNAMLESLAIGIPTICTDCPAGGAKMFIESGVNGILIPVKDTKALYFAMKDVVSNVELAERMSRNSILIKDKLSEQKICSLWEEEIKNLFK